MRTVLPSCCMVEKKLFPHLCASVTDIAHHLSSCSASPTTSHGVRLGSIQARHCISLSSKRSSCERGSSRQRERRRARCGSAMTHSPPVIHDHRSSNHRHRVSRTCTLPSPLTPSRGIDWLRHVCSLLYFFGLSFFLSFIFRSLIYRRKAAI
ncbi:uncharacterized protein EV420DRAFT_253449 [Desarmillaria tabescens]|uniref:Uncharacterized protein n=1 Tax=Armillaria tabescens TaxID=1929756 RepID=A0AA39KFM3_ARMTA|nr:uncharacterized protein EV420DRAFT_253449 [Desarmillaria tabescens]KAK0460137.1 hypothetical protein EV420DRAFT_253449 [Desarmillaria tabescens]